MTQRPTRQPLIDALRGFALLGVFLVNLRFFSLDALMTEAAQQALPSAALDHALRTGMEWLLDMKAITLFSLLFGIGVAMQMEGNTPGRMAAHLRRMAALLVIGLLHSVLLWWGDILLVYAVVGLLLPLFRHLGDRALLVSGVAVALLLPPLLSPWIRDWVALLTPRAQMNAMALDALANGTLAQAWWRNLQLAAWLKLSNWALLFFVLGRFLLGYWAGRRGLLQQPQAHLPLLRSLAAGGLLLGAAFLWVDATADALKQAWPALRGGVPGYLLRVSYRVAPLALGIAAAATFALLYLRPWAERVLRVFVPAGRMALSNYLLQSVICVPLFAGFGLGIGPLHGLWPVLLVAAVVFPLQLWASACWLRSHRFGPVEWLWRSASEGQWLPLRR
ncbi:MULTISPECIES: DUF418 domain-containing protein [Stenotrophomonas]|jgi:uncharacterized protein|uniref:DUF418 domain-containing protein n=1 Tax=Stenotrophomonas TaxID=40323 RepID=UPI00201CF4C0|nr:MULTISPECIES: DUF418 domain-containing protein [Stenotrophomonas]MBN5026416.1 DUF418 domain-containing protein [Stenotrophomonas maltophilia]MDH1274965.1 DUF418 domain-containing protein [Stenotrophomonas sp. GD03937]MDH1484891.1 DUF418 domain-containing protein [Stenotrophomonas sp. GD03712]UQY94705.1 DUF418 domain-containing protein [Stenotrophomonas maltophilia]WON68596.1 DUF418 domain-containing protein [Stenotrophomonas maltophilia]